MAITPYLLYQDAGAAVAWLEKAFGLRQVGDLYKDAAGRVSHASLKLGDAWLMLGSPGPDFKNPKALGQATQNLYVDVDDVEKHYARAVRAGAAIIEQPTDTFYGARRYGAEDPEGHRWYFAQEQKAKKKKAAAKERATRSVGGRRRARGAKRASR
jgi:uncharacterized glyoxalase superfamily protein PhnB